MRLGIGFKLGFLLAAFGIMATSLTAYYFYNSSRHLLTGAAERDLLAATQVVGRNMKITIDVIAEDSQLLAGMPVTSNVFTSHGRVIEGSYLSNAEISNYLLANDNDASGNKAKDNPDQASQDDIAAAENDKRILADTFTAMLAAHPEYFQIRLISIGQGGLELVRVERSGRSVIRVPDSELKRRGRYPYVTGTMRLARGDIYLSDITINHEPGTHAALNQPTVTVSTPVFSAAGKRLGMIVINVDLNGLARMLKNNLPAGYQLYLSNQWGDFLVHPDESQTFGFDRGKRILMQDTFPAVLPLIRAESTKVVMKVDDGSQQPGNHVAAFIRLPFGDTIDKRFVILGLAEPVESIIRETAKLRWDTTQIILLFSSLALILSALLSRIVTGPLISMVRSINRFSKDQTISAEPLMRNDELGLLSRSLYDMQKQIVAHLAELNASRQSLDHLARHDPLTGLPNRRMFFDRLEHAIANSRRSGKQLAVLFIDLDRFKEINDTYGHSAGDAVLVEVSKLLKSAVREVDTVARLGGDEFVILLEVIRETEDAAAITRKLHERFRQTMQIEGREMIVYASIGIGIFPRDGKDADELMQNADKAMYDAKHIAKNVIEFRGGNAA